ncbi:MAG: hypothetical protein L0Y68_07510 [Candidatus Dadabacteria bacterium]|nr:hypothetical protein [Candidatus Dadabacteria bacterium]
MKKTGNIQNWNEGDKKEITEKELKALYENGLYDSYDKTYIINGFKWKVVSKVVNPDSRVTYTLECVGIDEG